MLASRNCAGAMVAENFPGGPAISLVFRVYLACSLQALQFTFMKSPLLSRFSWDQAPTVDKAQAVALMGRQQALFLGKGTGWF